MLEFVGMFRRWRFPLLVASVVVAAAACNGPGASEAERPFGPRSKDHSCAVQGGLPDRACTPGAVFPAVTAAEVCRPGYSASVRNVPAALSREVYQEYGIVDRARGEYEVDHLVPLEAGGSNDIANLFPEPAEPRPGFHEKDQVENYLHDQVCDGTMSLLDAQRAIATNWVDVYQRLPPRGFSTVVPATPPPATGGGGVEITAVGGAMPGGRATVTVRTMPGVSCAIAYRTPAGTLSTAQGLTAASADADGQVSWSWEIAPTTRPGTGTVTVTCNGASASSPIPIG